MINIEASISNKQKHERLV